MGTIFHDAIVVTSFFEAHLTQARDKAIELGMQASENVRSGMNGYLSFFIAPDGSKEWWPDSDKGDERRSAWIEWAQAQYGAGVYFDFVAVRYGADLEHAPTIEAHNSNREDDE